MSQDSSTDIYSVWFRHSGEDPPDTSWYQKYTRKYTIEDIKEEVKGHTITHMIVDGALPDNIHLLAPELRHLRLKHVAYVSNLSE
ncbi:hypothetical protein EB796_002246 [Bugula neritina]|uniref:Uncharacterized protein n=1 Tax=Bugula neritina TaxID=10212 RepID=A0A7J7KMR9_BUGNE|nr:hypothetical protein EB796_002246 [Bugula neritina]